MANRKMTKEENEAWEKGYAKDLLVIGEFLEFLKHTSKKNFRLYFKDGTQIIATFIGAADSDNGLDLDDPYYEDLYELDFRVKIIEKKGSELNYKEEERISLNYHDFFIKFEPYEGGI